MTVWLFYNYINFLRPALQTDSSERKGEKMNRQTKFFKRGLLLTAVALAMKTVGMFFGAYISGSVGAEGVGLYTVTMTVYSFAVTLATSGISLTVTRLVASAIGEGKRDGVGAVLKGAVLYSLLFGILSSLLLFFGASFIGERILLDKRTTVCLKLLSLSLVPIALTSVISGYFVGVKRVGFNAFVSVVGQFIKIAVTVILVNRALPYGTERAVGALCFGISATELLSFLLIFIEFLFDRRRERISGRSSAEIKKITEMAVPLALSAYVRSVLLSIEHVLIPKRLRDRGESTSEAYAHYGILHGMAVPMVLYPMTPLSSFSGLLVPEFAEDMSARRTGRMSRVASKALNTTLTYSALASVFLFSFSGELGYIVYRSFEAGYYIAMLSPVIPIMYLDHVTDGMLKGLGEQVYSMWVNISDSVLSVILVWVLIPRFGITGYALVIIIMEGYNFIFSFIRLRKKTEFKLKIMKSLVIPLLCAALSSLIAKELFSFSGKDVSVFWLVMKMLFALCLFVAARALINTNIFSSLFKAKERTVKE